MDLGHRKGVLGQPRGWSGEAGQVSAPVLSVPVSLSAPTGLNGPRP